MTGGSPVVEVLTNATPRSRRRRTWIAAVLTFVLSGLCQVYAGRGRRGALVFILSMTASAAFLLVWMRHPSFRFMALGFVVAASIKIGLMVDAAWVARAAPVPFSLKAYNRWYIYVAALLLADYFVFPLFKHTLIGNGFEAFRLPAGVGSMEPSWMAGDYLMVAPLRRPPTRGQVVVYRMPYATLLKRVVALPGDTVAMSQGQLTVNGVNVAEPYVRSGDASAPDAFPTDSTDFYWQNRYLGAGVNAASYRPTLKTWGPLVLPDTDYFVLGDNREVGMDSRRGGFVPASAILARPLFIYWSWDADNRSVRWGRFGLTPR